MSRIPVNTRKHRSKAKEATPISPEEKRAAKEEEKQKREQRKAEEKARRTAEKAAAKAQKEKEQREAASVRAENQKEAHQGNIFAPNGENSRRKPGVPKGFKRGPYNKDGKPRKKPGPKPKLNASLA